METILHVITGGRCQVIVRDGLAFLIKIQTYKKIYHKSNFIILACDYVSERKRKGGRGYGPKI